MVSVTIKIEIGWDELQNSLEKIAVIYGELVKKHPNIVVNVEVETK